jgi:4-diphosphocytidyl-2-C-methyl-D-erythritol kinase
MMKALFDVPAPAKLNLFLHITGRRSDGYHLLQSAFMLIDWCDTLHFERRSDGKITREDLTTALPPDDLIVRAARALQTSSACSSGVHIGIEKHIPAQAGMGGGSSDAASTLLALNRLWGLNYSLERLSQIGLQLGADVPFFLGGHNAWVEGVG